MELEFSAGAEQGDGVYGFEISDFSSLKRIQAQSPSQQEDVYPHPGKIVDWEPMIRGILDDVQRGVQQSTIAAKFHNTLSEIIVAVSREMGQDRIVLTGGCFQNRYLTERTVRRLEESGFRPYWHQRVPPNDGGIALGQVYAAVKAQNTIMRNQVLEEETLT
jgi:hydrogenase maturation protein HypF